MVAVALVVLVAGAAGRLVLGAIGPRGSAAVASPPVTVAPAKVVDRSQRTPVTAEEWRALVEALYQRRAEAFSTASPTLLDDVYVQGSPLLSADAGFVSSLADAGERLRGYVPTVEKVTSAQAEGDHVGLDLVDSWAAAEVVAGGAVVRAVSARPASAVHMVLVRSGDSWLIENAQRTG
jgi:hypothetical protein